MFLRGWDGEERNLKTNVGILQTQMQNTHAFFLKDKLKKADISDHCNGLGFVLRYKGVGGDSFSLPSGDESVRMILPTGYRIPKLHIQWGPASITKSPEADGNKGWFIQQ